MLTGDWRNLRRLKPVSGVLLFLVIAAPWHVLAGLRNVGGADGHGFFWFYFVMSTYCAFWASAFRGLQQTAGVSLLDAAWGMAVSVELSGSGRRNFRVATAAGVSGCVQFAEIA